MGVHKDKKDGDEHDVGGILFAYIHVEDDVEDHLSRSRSALGLQLMGHGVLDLKYISMSIS